MKRRASDLLSPRRCLAATISGIVNNRSDLAGLAVAALVSSVLAIWVLQLWHLSPHVPIDFGGDSFLAMNAAKNMVGGWYSHSSLAGWPFGQDLTDYPAPGDLGNLILLWMCANILRHPGLTVNAYYLLSFPLVTAAAYVGFRSIGGRRWVSTVLAILYSLLPYHFLRSESHLLLSNYWVPPLVVAYIVRQLRSPSWILLDGFTNWEGWRRAKAGVFSRNTAALLGIGLVFGSGGFYYAIFATFLILMAASIDALQRRSFARLLSGLLVVIGIGGMLFASLVPSLMKIRAEGPNTEVAHRQYVENEIYGLRVVDLVLPLRNHRLPVFAEFRQRAVGLTGAEGTETLGLVGTLGFVVLIGSALGACIGLPRISDGASERTVRPLAFVAISCTLLGVGTGIGGVMASFGFTQVRAWNRISVFIAFAALGAVAIGMEYLRTRCSQLASGRLSSALQACLMIGLLIVGTLDQTSKGFIPPFKANDDRYSKSSAFVSRIEGKFGPDSALFQLPGIPFPENPPVVKMLDYDHLEDYLLAERIRISYGAIKGRDGEWAMQVARLPLQTALPVMALAGFDGLYVDRYGYLDQGVQLESRLHALLGDPLLTSDDQRRIVFDLRPLRSDFMAKLGSSRSTLQQIPPYLRYGKGFSEQEVGSDTAWRWARSGAEVVLVNRTKHARTVRLSFGLASNGLGHVKVLEGSKILKDFVADNDPESKRLILTLLPGQTVLRFMTNVPDIVNDPRTIQFRLFDAWVADITVAEAIVP